MIFKTIADETTLSGQRIVGALQARKIAQQQATAQLEIDITCLKEYQVACQNGTVTTEQFDAIMHKASASAVEYSAKVKAGTGTAQSYANAQRATNSALHEISIGAGIASKAVKLFSTALNMIAFTAIIQGVSWFIGKVDEWIVTAKEAKESADAFKQSLSTFFNETQTNLKTISSLSDRFNELSKNVDDNGKKVGGTEEEYAEFLDICQQVGQIMPELITGYTAEGEAIITLQGKVDSLTDSYKEAIRTKAALFLSNGDEDGNSIKSFFEDYNDFVNGYQGVLGLKISPSGQNTAEEFEEYYGYDKIHGWLSDVTDATLEDLGKLRAGTTEYVYLARVLKEAGYEISEISAENYNAVHDVFNNRMSVMEKGITDRVTNIRTAFQNMLYADSDYWKINDENVLSAINSLYASIDDEFIKQNELFNQTALQTFESNFVSLFNNDATKKAMVDFYTPIADDETVQDYTNRINSALQEIQSYCNNNGIVIPIEVNNSIDTLINNVKEKLQDDFDDKVGELTLEELKIAAEQVEVPDGTLLSWDELIAKIKEVQDSATDDEPLTFSTSLDKFQSSVKSAAEAYTTLLTGNYSSTDLLDSIQAINKAASEMGKSINWEDVGSLDELHAKIEEISNAYADSVLSGAGIDVDSKFGQVLANIVQETYNFEMQLSSLNTQIDSLQSAYSDLTDIVSTYNETGHITFDQLQTLLAMEPQYLSCLVDENGQLLLNQEAMLALANQRLNDAEAQAVQQAITELGQLSLQNEKTAVEENAQAFSNAVNDLAAYNEELAGTIGEASVASSVVRDLNTAISGAQSKGASDVQVDAILDNLNTKLQLIKKTRAGLGKGFGDIMGGAGKSSSAKSEFSETIDFFERRVKVLDEALSHLNATMENVTGSSARNNLIDAELNITGEKFKNYTDALAMYTEKADEAFFKLPEDISSKVKDGAVALTDFIGDGNKDVVEAIKDYESWAGKVADCKKELAGLRAAIRQLELEKFNNIMDDFSSQFDLHGDGKDLISRQVDLLKESGQLVGESFFKAQIDQSKKQLELLEKEKAQLMNHMADAVSSNRVQKGTDEWLEMVNALSDVDGSILDCKKSIEEFDNEILNLHTEVFDRIQEQFSDLDSEISNLIDMFDDFDVSDEKGVWSKEAIAQMGLMAQQYELAQYQVQQYNREIDELNRQYLAGRYSATEYADRLSELSSAQWDSVKSVESAKDAIMDLNEARVENEIKGIEKEIDVYDELTKAQIEALTAAKDLHDYEKSIAEKTGNITDLERQIAAMQNDTSAATVAKRKKLEEQLAEAKKDLEEAEYEHSIEAQENALNKQFEEYEKERNAEIDALRASLNDREAILAQSFDAVKANASIVGQEIATIALEHGITVSDALISPWKSGEDAIAGYGEVLAQGASAFIGSIIGVENEVWSLQAHANSTADSLAWMFATRADGLVSQLASSYYAEENLALMTQALQDSLVNTLERGYDASGIITSLDAVTEAANRTRSSIKSLGDESSDETKNDTSKTSTGGYGLSAMSHKSLSASTISHKNLSAYAGGTRDSDQGLVITDEDGYEMKLPKLPDGRYTLLNEGSQVFTREQTDRLYELSQVKPNGFDLVPFGTDKFLESLGIRSMPSVMPNNVNNNSVNFHYDSMLTVNGDVNDLKNLMSQMQKVADKSSDNAIRKLAEGIHT